MKCLPPKQTRFKSQQDRTVFGILSNIFDGTVFKNSYREKQGAFGRKPLGNFGINAVETFFRTQKQPPEVLYEKTCS